MSLNFKNIQLNLNYLFNIFLAMHADNLYIVEVIYNFFLKILFILQIENEEFELYLVGILKVRENNVRKKKKLLLFFSQVLVRKKKKIYITLLSFSLISLYILRENGSVEVFYQKYVFFLIFSFKLNKQRCISFSFSQSKHL